MSDFENLIHHAEFGKILQLADRLKREEQGMTEEPRLFRFSNASTSSMKPRKKTRWLASNSGDTLLSMSDDRSPYDGAAEFIRETLVPSPNYGSAQAISLVGRGKGLVTDSLINETINALISELKLCLELKEQRRAHAGQGEGQTATMTESMAMAISPQRVNAADIDGRSGAKTNSVAGKFSKCQTDILTKWMIEHRENPLPTQAEIRELAKATNLTTTQVVNWTTNVRKRNLKGTVDLGKKPHHFLDYLFLATAREKQMRMAHLEADMSPFDNSSVVDATTANGAGNGIKAFQQSTVVLDRPLSQPKIRQLSNIHRRCNSGRIYRCGNQKPLISCIPNQGGNLSGQEYASNKHDGITDNSLKFPRDDRYMFDEDGGVVERPKIVSFERSCKNTDVEPLPFLMEVPFDESEEWEELFCDE